MKADSPIPSPTPPRKVKRSNSDSGEEEKPKKAKQGTPKGSKQQAWTKEQCRQLYNAIHPPAQSINWKEVTSAVDGRDTESCRQKWRAMRPKIQDVIGSMGK